MIDDNNEMECFSLNANGASTRDRMYKLVTKIRSLGAAAMLLQDSKLTTQRAIELADDWHDLDFYTAYVEDEGSITTVINGRSG